MPPYHCSSVKMMNKNSLGRLAMIGGEVDDEGKSAIKEANSKALVLFGVTNSRSYSYGTTIHLEA